MSYLFTNNWIMVVFMVTSSKEKKMNNMSHFFEVLSFIVAIFLPMGGLVFALAIFVSYPTHGTNLHKPVFFTTFLMGLAVLAFFAWLFWK